MKKNYLLVGVIAVAVVLGAVIFGLKNKSTKTETSQTPKQPGQVTTTSGGKRVTAKQAYEISLPDAKKYDADGYLVDLYSLSSSYNQTYVDGTSETWNVIFHSANKKQYRVTVQGERVTRVDDIAGTKTVEIPSGWLDSADAVKLAADKCAGAPENSYFYSLITKVDNKSFSWGVSCVVGGKTQTIYLDAFSGKLE